MEPELSREKLCDFVIEGHPYPLFIVDKGLNIREFNPAAEKLTGQRLDGYIHGFLDAVRFQMGQIPLYFMPCSIEKTLHEIMEGFQVKASEKNISITLDLPKVLPPSMLIDKQQLERAVSNLLDNAIKYSPEESEVVIRAMEKEDSILFEIRDHGDGIYREDLPHIFEYFYRCKDKAGQVTGAGLGLAIVKGIIESHGGKIWAKSVPGKGTSFFFTIPKTETGKTR
jgi:two-component system phosphate regulon sensor histidine kinase PhoR